MSTLALDSLYYSTCIPYSQQRKLSQIGGNITFRGADCQSVIWTGPHYAYQPIYNQKFAEGLMWAAKLELFRPQKFLPVEYSN